MNIFYLDDDPILSAQYHCDKHVPKMVLETAQLLCSAFAFSGIKAPYKIGKGHMNHPCAKWVRESFYNYIYTYQLGVALCKEYSNRFGKIHKSEEVIYWCNWTNSRLLDINFKDPTSKPTPPALAMPEEYQNLNDPVLSYRQYYVGEKSSFAKWNHSRQQPLWYSEMMEELKANEQISYEKQC